MKKEEVKNLFLRYVAGEATEEEKSLLESWYLGWANDAPAEFDENNIEGYLSQLEKRNPYLTKRAASRSLVKIAAVLTLLIGLSGVIYYYSSVQHMAIAKRDTLLSTSIVPGSDKAILILDDGSKINLDAKKKGTIAEERGSIIDKTQQGMISYAKTNVNGIRGNNVSYNTIVTPRGGMYTVKLSDGTVVTLNAASSLHYPAAFGDKERVVELVGEAYFTVVHNNKQPFLVRTKDQLTEDIGTEFNISAYKEDVQIRTTLINGSIKVSEKNTASLILKPGEQSLTDADGRLNVDKHPDIEEVTAWKHGFFKFNGENIETVMRKISRWYAVNVVYEKGITKEGFYGTVSRNGTVRDVLNMLELTGLVHFKISGNEITVMH